MKVRDAVFTQMPGIRCLRRVRSDSRGRGVHPGRTQVFDDRPRFAVGRIAVLLGMDSLEHVAHFADPGRRHVAEDVPIKMNHAALPPRVGQILGGALHQAAAGIGDDELHTIEAAIDEVAKERRPAGFVLLSTFANAQISR